MMERRTFMGLTAMAGAAAMGAAGNDAQSGAGGRKFYEVRLYHVKDAEQKKGVEQFFAEAAIPALNRLGITPVGVFEDEKEPSPVYVVIPYPSLEAFATMTARVRADQEFQEKGAAFANATGENPAFTLMEVSLLMAFTGMPRLETPAKGPGRVAQLRIYESPSVMCGQKKIEMFNTRELAIFRKTGLNPVFFGEALAGGKMPNLTYMLAFESAEERDAAWGRFRSDPEWLELKAMPEYADKRILRGVTNLLLKPMPCSQI